MQDWIILNKQLIIKLSSKEYGIIKLKKNGNNVDISYELNDYKKTFLAKPQDLEDDEEFGNLIIKKLFYDIIPEDISSEWSGCITYFIELLLNFLISPNEKLKDFFYKFKDNTSFKIIDDGGTIKTKNPSKKHRIFSSGMSAGRLMDELIVK